MSREVRICAVCSTYNDPLNDECTNCQEDLSYEPITEVEEGAEDNNISVSEEETTIKKEEEFSQFNYKKTMCLMQNSLRNRADGKIIEIPFEGCIVGRNGDVEVQYFDKFAYISNVHAKLEYIQGELAIRDLGSTNGTRVNGEKLAADSSKILSCGDIVRLANIDFIVE